MPAPRTAINQQAVWKNDEQFRFARALIWHALELQDAGVFEFTTDIVPDAERNGGPNVPGCTATKLKDAHLISPIGHMQEGVWFAKRAKSNREGRKDAWNNVYHLTSRALAEEFLRRQHVEFREVQPEFAIG